jgi:rRNA maturation RNase YbeY
LALRVYYQKEGFRLRESGSLKNWILDIIANEGFHAVNLSFIFTDDAMIIQLNRDFLEHDYHTDVITFDMSESERSVEAEIYISVDTVKRNAGLLKLSFREEIARVMAHGVLHLLGYNDTNDISIKRMREREDFYLKRYFDET